MVFHKSMTACGFMLGLVLLASLAAAGVPSVVSHQGRLLGSDDKPVADGNYVLIYSLFTEPDGGIAVWTENQDITTKGGLFSVMLGSHNPLNLSLFDNDSLYLQTQVAGEAPLLPRLRLGSVPFASKTARIEGDVTTAPGLMTVSKKGLNAVNVKRAVTSRVDDVEAAHWLDDDSDDDGVMDRSVASSCDATGARLAIGTKGTSAKREIRASTDNETGTLALGADLDGDGVMDNAITDSVDAAGARRRLAVHNLGSSGQDGVELALLASPDSVVENSYVRKNGALVSADYDRKSSSSNSHRSSFFDVFTEATLDQDCDATGSRLAIKTKGTSAKRLIAGGDCDDTDAMLYTDCDDDGDGLPESVASQSSSSTGAEFSLSARANDGTPARISTNFTVAKQTQQASFGEKCFIDGDDVPESEVSHSVTPTTSSVAIKTKGTGAEANRSASVTSSTDPFSGSVACDIDDDGDGLPEDEASLHVTPTTSGVAIKTKGTGADPNRVVGATDDTSAVVLLATDDASITMKVRKGGVVNGSIIVTNTTMRMVELDSDGDGYLDHSLGIGVDATHRIDVAGGAYCDGTDWVNASDANVKENFKPVNGGELLEKIGTLPISQWNYKSESAEVMHIGPTAQDFKRVFGVGSDGKSISTIDPAGIALAAIKELHMENITLKGRIADLQAQLDDLKQKAATTDEMQAQITKLSAMVEIIMGARNADEGTTRMASSTLSK